METYKFKHGITGKIERDDDPESPREWDNLGTMATWHRRYNLGDVQPKESPPEFMRQLAEEADPTLADRIEYWESGPGFQKVRNFYAWNPNAESGAPRSKASDPEYIKISEAIDIRVQALIDRVLDQHYIILPLYLYDHSGITMNTSGFSCPWDSGQVGVIYVSIAKAKAEYGWKNMNLARRRRIEGYLKGEVKTYDQYLTGDVYGYTIEGPGGEDLDSCWGFYGEEYAIEEMNSIAHWHEADFEKEIATETQMEINEEVEG